MNIPRGPLLLFLLLFAPGTFRTLCEHLDWHGLSSPLPLVHRLGTAPVLPLVFQDVRVEMTRVLDITFAPGLPRMVNRPRPPFLLLHEQSDRDHMGHGRTDVVDQALEGCVAAAARFGRIVGGEVFDEVVVVFSSKFDADAVRSDEL